MPYCTIVEFEWSDGFAREDFESAIPTTPAGVERPSGRLARISGFDEKGARMVEVWQSAEDARAFAESSQPALSNTTMPPPAHILGFEVSEFEAYPFT